MARAARIALSGWGRCPVEDCVAYRPERWREISEIICSNQMHSVLPRGAGRSYGDAALNADGAVVILTRLSRYIDFNPETGVVECEAGVTFDDLLRTFVPKGYFPPVTPGTKFITVGGAFAADIHGKNHHRDGSFASHVLAINLLDAGGNVIRCSPTSDAEAFWATAGGMGLTGTILSVRFKMKRLTSSYLLVSYEATRDLDETLNRFQDDNAYLYSVAWVDCLSKGRSLGRSVLMRANEIPADGLPEQLRGRQLEVHSDSRMSVPFNFPEFALNHVVARVFNTLYYRRYRKALTEPTHYDPFFYPLDAVANWNRSYGRRGFYQYQVTFDDAVSSRAIASVLDSLSKSGTTCFLAVMKAFGEASGGLLSFPKKGVTLSVDIPNRERTQEYLAVLNKIVRKWGGRAYLAKDACMTAETFQDMYPLTREFQRVKASLDPNNRFCSSLARRIGLA